MLQGLAAGACAPWVQGAAGMWIPTGAIAAPAQVSAQASALGRVFADPPPSAKPGVYWYWTGGNVTREGITADLEAMHEAGIGRVMLFSIGKSGPETPVQPPADALTPYWWELVRHAAAEAGRLDIEVVMNICDGWGTAAGPWITPELSMQQLVWSDTVVEGGKRASAPLPRPEARLDYYRDVRTIAVPFPEAWAADSANRRARVSTDLPAADPQKLADPATQGASIDTDRPGYIEFSFDKPFTLRSVTVRTPPAAGYAPGVWRAANSLTIEASDDGVTFRPAGALEYPHHGWQTDLLTLTHAVPQTTAKVFRFSYKPGGPYPYEEDFDFGQNTKLVLSSLVLSSTPQVHHLQIKTGLEWGESRRMTAKDLPDSACVQLSDIHDLTDRLRPDGTLDWTAPAGRWRVIRIGCTTTGKKNSAAGAGTGLECDRFNREAAKALFDGWFGEALRRVGPELAGKVLHGVHVDSWEAAGQTWSPRFAEQFQGLRGYDLKPWLAVMTGVPVESADHTERVLLDVRRTINDLTQTEFFGAVADLAHARGCIFTGEVPNPTFPADGLQAFSKIDFPSGEFWLNSPRNDKPTDIKDAVSGARVYGRQVVGAEAFTDNLMNWTEQPFTFKALGDHNWCQGINRFMLHVWVQQPWLDRAPGMTLNGIGTFFSRTQTWWKPGKAWFDYLRRSQALLQQGRAVSDVAYFTGEDIPARAFIPSRLSQPMPKGYAYDSVNRDALLRLARVEDGRLVLEDGSSWRVLVLPDSELMTPEIAVKLRELVAAGLTVVGPRPNRSPSLQGGAAASDAVVRRVAGELWAGPGETRFGKGRVISGRSLASVLAELGVQPDTTLAEPLEWTHRRGEGWDLYFVSNQSKAAVHTEARFRVSGRRPQLWLSDTGEVRDLAEWREEDGATVVPLALDPAGSAFVVFAESSVGADPIVALDGPRADSVELRSSGGRAEAWVAQPGRWSARTRSGRRVEISLRDAPPVLALDRPWSVTFADRLPAPRRLTLAKLASWSEQTDPDVRFYSGTARYETTFALPAALHRRDLRLFLDLGEVADLAEVRLNGRDLGVLWKPPFRMEVTAFVRPGENRLEIAVSNTWRNRMIGDYGKPLGERTTYVVPLLRKGKPWLPGGPGVELSPAGLIGPVRIEAKQAIAIG
jgi:hypothetical protein